MAEAWIKHGGTVREAVVAGETWLPEGLVFEATAPDAAFDNVMRCVEANVPVVTGTTGWLERLEELRDAVAGAKALRFGAPTSALGCTP